ncbi:branched-chain amino acid ABC transporter substrate-binding protein [bacterium]|nr:branched-chain amino acid ABC transporter substrate-binding protein [bacterium]
MLRFRSRVSLASLVIGAASAAILAGPAGGPRPASAGDETLKIAVCGPMTGGQKKQGDDVKNAVSLALDEWNAKGGVLGKKIEMISRDDEAKESQAVACARQIAAAGVVGIIGHFNSGCTIPASEIYKDAKLVMITPSATNPKVTDRKLWNVFRVCGRDDDQGGVAAKFVLEKLKPKKVAILHDKTQYGEGLAKQFRDALKAAGGVTITRFDGISQEETDYKAILGAVKKTEPDLWYYGGMYDKGAPITIQARDVGLMAPLVSGDGLKEEEFLSKAGSKCEPCFVTFGPDPNGIPTAKAFLESYKKKFGQEGPYSVYAYDAANILLEGIKAAGSTDGEKIAEAIRKRAHDGALGKLEFDDKGDLKTSIYVVWEVEKGAKGFKVCWSPK